MKHTARVSATIGAEPCGNERVGLSVIEGRRSVSDDPSLKPWAVEVEIFKRARGWSQESLAKELNAATPGHEGGLTGANINAHFRAGRPHAKTLQLYARALQLADDHLRLASNDPLSGTEMRDWRHMLGLEFDAYSDSFASDELLRHFDALSHADRMSLLRAFALGTRRDEAFRNGEMHSRLYEFFEPSHPVLGLALSSLLEKAGELGLDFDSFRKTSLPGDTLLSTILQDLGAYDFNQREVDLVIGVVRYLASTKGLAMSENGGLRVASTLDEAVCDEGKSP